MRLNILAIVSLVTAQIPEKDNYYVTDPPLKVKDDLETVKIEAANSFGDCSCDITAGSCDEYCCCDKDCQPKVINYWKSDPVKFCRNMQEDLVSEDFQQCFKAKNIMTIDDIKGGFALFKKVPITLLCPFTQGSVASSNDFIEPIAKPADMDKLIKESADFEIKSYSSVTNSPLKDYHDKLGYQVYESVVGFLDDGAGGAIHKPANRINVQSGGLFGECNDLHFLNFLEPIEARSCSFHRQTLTKDFCENTLSIDHILKAIISKDGTKISDTDAGVKVVPNIVAKYGFVTKDYFSLDANPGSNKATDDDLTTLEAKPKFDGNTCDNFAIEYHLHLGVSQALREKVPFFRIDSAKLDIVLGSESANDDEEVTITRKTSVTYFETKKDIENEDGTTQTFVSESHPNQGNLGYIRDNIIKVGKLNSEDPDEKKRDAILEQKSGFYIRGAANSGQCYFLKKRVDDAKADSTRAFDNIEGEEKINYLVAENIDEKHYFEDPLLTFDDSILYGCHMDMNYEELQEFCGDKMDRFKYLALFQNIFSLDKIAKFGNSSIYNQKDWITVDKDQEMFKKVDFDSFSFDRGKCRMYGMQLDIYYKKIGATNAPQNVIVKAELKLVQNSNPFLWKFTRPDPTVRQRFQIGVSINYYQIEQDRVLFVPLSPQAVYRLNRNVLYPFIVYGSKDNQQSEAQVSQS